MKIIITVKDTDNIIGLKEDVVCRIEEITDVIRVDVEEGNDDLRGSNT